MTLTAVVDGDESVDAVAERLAARAASLRADADAAARPAPGRAARASPRPRRPSTSRPPITRAVERIAAGELTKVVLAREVRVHTPDPIDPAPIYDGLRTVFPSCYCYLVGTPELAFVGASPELLVRRDGARAQTVALAGTRRRSADPAVDRHLGEQLLSSPKDREEQAIVTRRIERTLDPVSRLGRRRRRARARQGPQRPAPGDADPRAAGRAGRLDRARRPPAPDARRRRRAAEKAPCR